MHIQFLNGGLANQTFQYIFARFAENYLDDGEPWYLDDSFFYVNNVHNGYELKKVFGIEANLLSSYFDQDVWDYMIKNKKENNLNYCETNASDFGFDLPQKVVYVEGNAGPNAYRDMQLMSMCRNMIISNSAFSYLAALLNPAIHISISMTSDREF